MPATFHIPDPKFSIVANHLLSRGWAPAEADTLSTFPHSLSAADSASNCSTNAAYTRITVNDDEAAATASNCSIHVADLRSSYLFFTNLATTDFSIAAEANCIVNHIKGSQHLSNKALLAYHTFASGTTDDVSLPKTWSAAHQDLVDLLGTLLVQSAYCAAKSPSSTPSHSNDALRRVQTVLRRDPVFAKSATAKHVFALLTDSPSSTACSAFESSAEGKHVAWGGTADIWIVKPVGSSCGQGVRCVRGLVAVLTAVQELSWKAVVQKYIERPLLARGARKFDIRQWILVTNVDPLILYGFSECYLRLSSKPFSLADTDLADSTVHLCNHAVQKLSLDASREDVDTWALPPPQKTNGESGGDCDTMMGQHEFERALDARYAMDGVFQSLILPQIQTIATNALLCVRDKLVRVGRGFEWLGLDLMVADGPAPPKVLLLEVNVSPDISLSTPVTSRLVGPAVADLFALLLDEQAVDNPVTAAAGAAAAGRSGSAGGVARKLQWELWHSGATRGKGEAVAFTRAKREVQDIGGGAVDYSPRKLDVALCALNAVHGQDEDDDEF